MSPKKSGGFARGSDDSLETAHVLFMDVVSYSTLGMERQTEVISELQKIVRALPDFQRAHSAGELISLPTGDGMALVFFGDPVAPVRCAVQMDAAIRTGRAPFQLRMGIHTGPVYRVADINANQNVAGSGINMAQRVMDCGDAGHILMSKAVADMLVEFSAWKSAVRPLGDVAVKHGILVQVFNLVGDEYGNPCIPSKIHSGVPIRPRVPAQQDPPAGQDMRERDAPGRDSNPFNPWRPVTPPAFVGRRSLLGKMQAAVDEGRSVSVVGDWRIGKSSVLNTFVQRLESSGRVVKLLSGNATEGASPAAFVEHITGVRSAASTDAAADELSEWAKRESKPGLSPVLVVDEFDCIITRFDPRFFERLRGMLTLSRMSVVVASRREIDRVYHETGRLSPFNNILELFWVGLLDAAAADELASRGPSLSDEARAIIRTWAGRHPYFIQLIGRKLIDSIRFGDSLDDATQQFLAEGQSRLRELWQTLSDKDQQTLRASLQTPQPHASQLRWRGLLTDDGKPFGRLLVEWLQSAS